MPMRGQTTMFDGAAGAPLRRTRAEQRENNMRARAAREALALSRSERLFALTDLTAAGDAMQSAASRVSAGIRRIGADRALGYEDSMALRELDSAIAAWTEARR